jgi:hypothetical protein
MNEITPEMTIFKKAAETLSDYAGIEKSKALYFIQNVGLRAIFENPSIICTNEEQKQRILDLKLLIEGVGDAREPV